jgi:hypothetical protein
MIVSMLSDLIQKLWDIKDPQLDNAYLLDFHIHQFMVQYDQRGLIDLRHMELPRFTESIDDASCLVQLIPDTVCHLSTSTRKNYAGISNWSKTDGKYGYGECLGDATGAANVPIAICIAVLESIRQLRHRLEINDEQAEYKDAA